MMMMMMMMTTTTTTTREEDEQDRFRAKAEECVDRSYDENLPILRSEITKSLGEMKTLQDHLDAFSQLDWAQGLEDSTADVIESMAGDRDYCRRGAAHFATKETALAETLRGKASWSYATRAELVEIAAGARGLRGVCLRVLAAGAEEEDVVYLAAMEYLAHVARDTPNNGDSIPVFPDEAVAQVHAAAVSGARDDPAGVRCFVQGFLERAGSFRRGAAEFVGGDDVDQVFTAQKLMKLAGMVEALCADTEVFVHKVVSSPYWRVWRSKNRGR